jgi:hypothetical protein
MSGSYASTSTRRRRAANFVINEAPCGRASEQAVNRCNCTRSKSRSVRGHLIHAVGAHVAVGGRPLINGNARAIVVVRYVDAGDFLHKLVGQIHVLALELIAADDVDRSDDVAAVRVQ